jgi:hypothetical protein
MRAASIFSKVDFRRRLSPFFAALKRLAGRDARAPILSLQFYRSNFLRLSFFKQHQRKNFSPAKRQTKV